MTKVSKKDSFITQYIQMFALLLLPVTFSYGQTILNDNFEGFQCGSLIEGSIVQGGEVDQIRFLGQQDQKITLTLIQTSGFASTRAQMRLLSPATRTEIDQFNANGQNQYTLTESGEFLIQLQAANLVSTGTYSLGMECIVPLNPIQSELSCGDQFISSISLPGEVDQVRFAGSQNDIVTLTLVQTAGFSSTRARVRVLTPTIQDLVAFNANGQQQRTLPENGDYVIQIQAANLVSTGDYTIGLECL